MRFTSLEVCVCLFLLSNNFVCFFVFAMHSLPSHVVITLMKVSGFVCIQFHLYLGVVESLFRVMLRFSLQLTN